MVLFGRALTVLSILSLTSATVSPPMRVSFRPPSLARVRTAYKQFSEEHYMPIACIQSGILRASADGVSQALRGVPLDMHHMAAYGTLGVLFSGLVGASWLAHLESQLGPGTTPKDVGIKTAADFFCYAPCANSAYLFMVPFLTALYTSGTIDLTASTACLLNGFAAAMALEASLFAPYNLLSFRMIPATFRPQTTATACFAYTVGLSAIC